MGKLFFIIALIAGVYFANESGLLYALMNGNTPEPGRVCEACGPKGGSAFLANSKADLRWPIDSTIGFSTRDRLPAVAALGRAIDECRIHRAGNHTKIKVLASDKLSIYGCMYRVVKVKVLEGSYKGRSAWMLREDVIDNPLQSVINYFRPGNNQINDEAEHVTKRPMLGPDDF